MRNVNEIVLFLFFAFLGIDTLILFMTWIVKSRSRRDWRIREGYLKTVEAVLRGEAYPETRLPRSERFRIIEAWNAHAKSVEPDERAREWFYAQTAEWGLLARAERLLGSPRFSQRAAGIGLLSSLPPEARAQAIRRRLPRERNPLIALRLVVAALEIEPDRSMEPILACFRRQDAGTRERILAVLESNPNIPAAWAEGARDTTDSDARLVLLAAVSARPFQWTPELIARCLRDPNPEVFSRATVLAYRLCPELIDLDAAIRSDDGETVRIAVNLMLPADMVPSREKARSLLEDERTRDAAIEALRKRVLGQGRYLDVFLEWHATAESEDERTGWAQVLGTRAEYYLHRLEGRYGEKSAALIADMIRLGYTADIIAFLNDNRNPEREEKLRGILGPILDTSEAFRAQCGRFLEPALRSRWGIPEPDAPKRLDRVFATLRERLGLTAVMLVTAFAMPVGYFLAIRKIAPFLRPGEVFSGFILHVQNVFLVYTVAISALYLVLMAFSRAGLIRQRREWSLADRKFLHTAGILPPVSIVVPAYNEEKTITESVHSLLGLNYPDFEVIVVNDGSSDETFETAMRNFEMKRIDGSARLPIDTAPVIGVYRSATEPNLYLIDKLNGGKADSLNAGIGLARNPYVCTIDADSLLEPETLLRMLFRTIVTKREIVACGGNVIPVNGCETQKGTLVGIHFPRNKYARYQTIEYLRSFIAGRVGWVRLQSLIIISGTLGVFSRKRLLEVGGYLTGRTPLGRDTVGEDFEIVIRLSRHMRERGRGFLVDYAHNANCWTEVPDNQDDLIAQRDRWHRGLIENMIFHRKLLFNPKYGQTGLLAIPYYFIFELIGPFVEAIGYVTMFVAFFFGLLPPSAVVLLFSVIVLLGLMVSTSALLLSERGVVYFQGREFRSIVAYCLLENLGYRQFMGLLRSFSYVGFLLGRQGWRKFARKGFAPRGSLAGPSGKGARP